MSATHTFRSNESLMVDVPVLMVEHTEMRPCMTRDGARKKSRLER